MKYYEFTSEQLNKEYYVCPLHNGDASTNYGGTCKINGKSIIDKDTFCYKCCAHWNYPTLTENLQYWYDHCSLFKKNWEALQREAADKGEVLMSPGEYYHIGGW